MELWSCRTFEEHVVAKLQESVNVVCMRAFVHVHYNPLTVQLLANPKFAYFVHDVMGRYLDLHLLVTFSTMTLLGLLLY